ncbi:unnamed protein product, partial [Mesorhabditis spiculigera]
MSQPSTSAEPGNFLNQFSIHYFSGDCELCLVCNDQASGFHYGIPSCNGCKTFFRRAIVQNLKFDCKRGGQCRVDKSERCACRHCRLKKCIDMGMDRYFIQNSREPIGYTKRSKKKKENSLDGSRPGTSKQDGSPGSDSNWSELDNLLILERKLQMARLKSYKIPASLRAGLLQPEDFDTELDDVDEKERPGTSKRKPLPATGTEMSNRLDTDCYSLLKWALGMPGFKDLTFEQQVGLVHAGVIYQLALNWTYYSDPEWENCITLPDGVWFDCGQDEKDPVFVTERQHLINGIRTDIHGAGLDEMEFVAFKALLFYDPALSEIDKKAKEMIGKHHQNISDSLHTYLSSKHGGTTEAGQRFCEILFLGPRLAAVETEFREACFAVDLFGQIKLSPFTRELLFRPQ